eukprot:7952800-Alexandrium_andersonii.AAC.1
MAAGLPASRSHLLRADVGGGGHENSQARKADRLGPLQGQLPPFRGSVALLPNLGPAFCLGNHCLQQI